MSPDSMDEKGQNAGPKPPIHHIILRFATGFLTLSDFAIAPAARIVPYMTVAKIQGNL